MNDRRLARIGSTRDGIYWEVRHVFWHESEGTPEYVAACDLAARVLDDCDVLELLDERAEFAALVRRHPRCFTDDAVAIFTR